jgi:hypothetical protein
LLVFSWFARLLLLFWPPRDDDDFDMRVPPGTDVVLAKGLVNCRISQQRRSRDMWLGVSAVPVHLHSLDAHAKRSYRFDGY